jgi:hypothetical protein
MSLSPVLYQNDFTTRIRFPDTIWRVDAMKWSNIGGPDTCAIKGTGDWDIDEAILLLRAPVEIFAPNGDCVWWGYVDSVKMADGAIVYGEGMDSVSNRIRVMYPNLHTPSRGLTLWTSDTDSIARFGTKELQTTTTVTGATGANGVRDTLLSTYKWPSPLIQHNPNNIERFIELSCKGWWNTLGWKYYGGVSQKSPCWDNDPATFYDQHLGDSAVTSPSGSTLRAIGQKLTASYTGTIDSVVMYFAAGSEPRCPADIYLMDNTATSNPGSLTTDINASSEITVSIIQGFVGFEAYTYKFDVPVAVTVGDQFWLVVDSTDKHKGGYYRNYTCQTVGATGRVWNGTTWEAPTTAFNMVYQLNFTTENSIAFSDCLDQAGQFFVGHSVPVFGVTSPAEHSGNPISALTFAMNMLEAGSSNNRRLLPYVNRQRYVTVTEEAVGGASTAKIMLSRDSGVYQISGHEPWPPYQNPCGNWCTVDSLIPSTISASRSVDPSVFMVENATYQGSTGGLLLHPRGIPSLFEVYSIERK